MGLRNLWNKERTLAENPKEEDRRTIPCIRNLQKVEDEKLV